MARRCHRLLAPGSAVESGNQERSVGLVICVLCLRRSTSGYAVKINNAAGLSSGVSVNTAARSIATQRALRPDRCPGTFVP